MSVSRAGDLLPSILSPVLRHTACPQCDAIGFIEVELLTSNNGLRLRCSACESTQPFEGLPRFLPQKDGRRRNAISRLDGDPEALRCFACGLTGAQLRTIGRGLQMHHVVPHSLAGDEGPQIPLCTLCHPIVTALQHAEGRLLKTMEVAVG